MLRSRARQALTMLDLPAPDGAATMNRVPRMAAWLVVVDGGRVTAGRRPAGIGPPSYLLAALRGRASFRSLDVLHLLADLVDQHLQFHRRAAGAAVDRLRAEGVGLAVELLQQEIQAPADRLALGEHAADLGDVAGEAVELLVHVELLQREHQLLLHPRRI